MSFDTYAGLQTAVASWLDRDNLTAFIPDLILLGEKWVFRKARTRDMETALSVAISGGVATIPTGYLAMKHAAINGSPTRHLKMRTASWILENYPVRSTDSKPFYIAPDGASFIFGPYPDSDYSVIGTYYARPTSIQTSVNSVFTANPDLYLFAALCEAEPFVKNDKRLPMWMMKRDTILRDMNQETKEGQYESPAMEIG